MDDDGISPSGWAKGISISVLASIIGGISKLVIRKSWLMQVEENCRCDEGLLPANDDPLSVNITTEPNHMHMTEDLLEGYDNSNEQIITIDPSHTHMTEDLSEGYENSNEQIIIAIADQEEQCRPSPLYCYLLRGCGMFGMSVLNPICCVLSMNYASPSILAPFSGITLVWVICFSPLVNNEQPSSRQLLACGLIIVGEVVTAIFGDHTNDSLTVEEVKLSYKKPFFILYFVGLLLYLILMTYFINNSKSRILQKFAWGCSSGAITGVQNFLKDSLTIVKAVGVDPQQQQLPWIFYILSLSAAGAAFIGLLILTACMRRYDATYCAATFVGSFVVSASIMAAVHYNTFVKLEGVLNYVMYPLGIAVLMIGVYLLVGESSESYEEDELVDQRRQQDTNIDDISFDSEHHMFGYTEASETAREEAVL